MSKDTSVIEGTAIDPVCDMSVAIKGASHIAVHEGAEHYFCSSLCHDKFFADPELYLSDAHLDAVEDVPEGTILHARCIRKSGSLVRVMSDLREGART